MPVRFFPFGKGGASYFCDTDINQSSQRFAAQPHASPQVKALVTLDSIIYRRMLSAVKERKGFLKIFILFYFKCCCPLLLVARIATRFGEAETTEIMTT